MKYIYIFFIEYSRYSFIIQVLNPMLSMLSLLLAINAIQKSINQIIKTILQFNFYELHIKKDVQYHII
jgi:hypothetical protein